MLKKASEFHESVRRLKFTVSLIGWCYMLFSGIFKALSGIYDRVFVRKKSTAIGKKPNSWNN